MLNACTKLAKRSAEQRKLWFPSVKTGRGVVHKQRKPQRYRGLIAALERYVEVRILNVACVRSLIG